MKTTQKALFYNKVGMIEVTLTVEVTPKKTEVEGKPANGLPALVELYDWVREVYKEGTVPNGS
jgi:hypothetical protein